MHPLSCRQLLNCHWLDQQFHVLSVPLRNVLCFSSRHCPMHALLIWSILERSWREQLHHVPKLPPLKLLDAACWRKPVMYQLLSWHVLIRQLCLQQPDVHKVPSRILCVCFR